MVFQRRNVASRVFKCNSGEGEYRIVRPSFFDKDRGRLDISCADREFEVRTEGEEIWLLDGETTIGYATSANHSWHLLIEDTEYVLDRPKPGVNHSLVETPDGEYVAQARGQSFPLRIIEMPEGQQFSHDQKAFILMVMALSWREGDRRMVGFGGPVGGV